LFFFLPATIFLFWRRRPSQKIFILALLCFLAITIAWVSELLRESGGFSTYLSLARSESIFKMQSVLFGNGWQDLPGGRVGLRTSNALFRNSPRISQPPAGSCAIQNARPAPPAGYRHLPAAALRVHDDQFSVGLRLHCCEISDRYYFMDPTESGRRIYFPKDAGV